MSLKRFFQIIDKSFIGKAINKRIEIIGATDPNRIYVENIRSFYNIPLKAARFFCNMAVREKLFVRKIEVMCPNEDRSILVVDSVNDIPDLIHCNNCEMLEENKFEFAKEDIKTMEFYQIVK